VVVVATGIGIWVFLRSERGQKLIEVASDGINLARKAAQAPGTATLRAPGCTQAMVIPTSQVRQKRRQAKCQGSYARDGSFLGSLDHR
jgi:hypothetical protein